MPLNERMEDYESEISVIDVYDIASEIGKEFEKIIDCFGSEAVTGLMPKVITALEHLEVLASKNERDNSNVQDLNEKIMKLESDKLEKAEDRLRYERDLELIEDHWRKETQDLESVVSTLQEENRKLKNALAAKQDLPAQQMTPEVDIAALQRLRAMVDQLRDNLRKAERDIASKTSEIDEMMGQIKRLTGVNKELSRKKRLMQFQIRGLVDERADLFGQVQSMNHLISSLQEKLGEAVKESNQKSPLYKPVGQLQQDDQDPNRPRFTTAELKELLHERNNLKAKVNDLEDELESFRPKQEPDSLASIEEEEEETGDKPTRKKLKSVPSNPLLVVGWPLTSPQQNSQVSVATMCAEWNQLLVTLKERRDFIFKPSEEDLTVQGPLPYEPDDAPWKKSDSGIRKFFRKLFSESNVSFLGNSPKRSLSSLSKMTLAGGPAVDAAV